MQYSVPVFGERSLLFFLGFLFFFLVRFSTPLDSSLLSTECYCHILSQSLRWSALCRDSIKEYSEIKRAVLGCSVCSQYNRQRQHNGQNQRQTASAPTGNSSPTCCDSGLTFDHFDSFWSAPLPLFYAVAEMISDRDHDNCFQLSRSASPSPSFSLCCLISTVYRLWYMMVAVANCRKLLRNS